jgi:serine/threonine-protein kinase
MQVRTPLVTLLAGCTLAVALLGLSVLGNREKAATAPAAGLAEADPAAGLPAGAPPATTPNRPPGSRAAPAPPTPAPPPTALPSRSASPPEPPRPPALDVTWTGPADRGTTIAIVAKGTSAIAYLCDGARTEAWLQGTATGGRLDLAGAGNARLTGTFTGARAEGTVTVRGQRFGFDVPAAAKGSRLFRATRTVRGAKIIAGWIVRADGRQVGLATVDGTLVRPSMLDVATGTATVAGATVTAAPAQPDGAR